MNLWKRVSGLVLGPSGRGLLTGTGECCCAPVTCDCGPPCHNSGDKIVSTGYWKVVVPFQGLEQIVSTQGTARACCGPVGGQRWRSHQKMVVTNYANRINCPGKVRQSIEVWDYYVAGVPTRRKTRLGVINSGTCIVNYTETIQDYPIEPCVFFPAASQGGQFTATAFGFPVGANRGSGKWITTASIMQGKFYAESDTVEAKYEASWSGYLESNDVACIDPTCRVSCCLPEGECREDLTESECLGMNGVVNPPGFSCYESACDSANPRDKGACCDPATGDCVLAGPDQCLPPRVFKGIGTACAFGTCPQPTGNCCKDGGCTIKTLADCNLSGGTWGGPGTNCSNPNTCASPGACCTTQFGCLDLLPQACTDLGGVFQGPGTLCAGTVCTGACCNQTGHGFDCQQSTPQGCAGTFYGLGSSCFPSPCGVIPPRPAGTGAFR